MSDRPLTPKTRVIGTTSHRLSPRHNGTGGTVHECTLTDVVVLFDGDEAPVRVAPSDVFHEDTLWCRQDTRLGPVIARLIPDPDYPSTDIVIIESPRGPEGAPRVASKVLNDDYDLDEEGLVEREVARFVASVEALVEPTNRAICRAISMTAKKQSMPYFRGQLHLRTRIRYASHPDSGHDGYVDRYDGDPTLRCLILVVDPLDRVVGRFWARGGQDHATESGDSSYPAYWASEEASEAIYRWQDAQDAIRDAVAVDLAMSTSACIEIPKAYALDLLAAGLVRLAGCNTYNLPDGPARRAVLHPVHHAADTAVQS